MSFVNVWDRSRKPESTTIIKDPSRFTATELVDELVKRGWRRIANDDAVVLVWLHMLTCDENPQADAPTR